MYLLLYINVVLICNDLQFSDDITLYLKQIMGKDPKVDVVEVRIIFKSPCYHEGSLPIVHWSNDGVPEKELVNLQKFTFTCSFGNVN